MNALTDLVRAHRKNGQQAFVVSDSLFSMDGDIASLKDILELCETYDMMSIIDEAHATGVYGNRGTGLIEEMSLDSDRWIRTGTLSKAIGCMGGFVSGPKQLTNWLCNSARSYIYSTSAPSYLVKSAKKSIELIPSMTQQRIALRTRSRNLRARLKDLGFRVGGDDSPIIAIYVEGGRSTSHMVGGSGQWSQAVMAWSHKLQECGLFVPGIRPPTVPESGCLLRVSLNTSHTDEDLDRLVQVLAT
jgi:7-keto-8-aminopelargonate synthetase-like enzyme